MGHLEESRSQTEKAEWCLPKAGERAEWGVIIMKYKVTTWENDKVLKTDGGEAAQQ